ncbi:MAG: hydrogenase 3 maturation endopeptidase HyCI [Candidatus Omnitrophica bacterium]|nr:hydrogenase 3 maturation endopeptidase HyCI [Candidatus Omnitrophota bacterium]MDD5512296.1 hydrogenase 3 maturation endopeptidase HyCI [Candidatus Omnitrophota bacterium]
MLEHLKSHLQGKVVLLGIGNTLRSDDGAGSLLACRLKDKVPYIVYDAGANPENYLGKIIKDNPDNIIIVDAADFAGKPGEIRLLEGQELKTSNLFSTHNASISLTINYLQSSIGADIIILIIQPKSTVFGDSLSSQVDNAVKTLAEWFLG